MAHSSTGVTGDLSGSVPSIGPVMGINVMGQSMSYDDKKRPTGGVQPEGPAKRRRVWTEGERSQHKSACTGKQKLTYGQKMEIIRRHESVDSEEHRTQAQLAEMFGKSRSAISKILRPDSMDRIKATAAAGIDHQVKRYFPPEHPELERRLFLRIEQSFRKVQDGPSSKYTVGSQSLCANAEQIAKELGIENFKPTAGWYSRFVKRYGLAKPPQEDSQLGILAPGGQGSMLGGIHSVSGISNQVIGGQSLGALGVPRPMDQMSERNTKTIVVPFKAVWLETNRADSNTRRLDVPLELDEHNQMIGGFETTMNHLRQTFHQELMTSQARVSYKDDEGDDVVISSDVELLLAINLHKGMQGGTVKLTLSPIMQTPTASVPVL